MMLLPEPEGSAVRWPRITCLFVACTIALASAGCAEKSPAFVSEGAQYSSQTISSVFKPAAPYAEEVLGTGVSETAALRSEALGRLRARGDQAADAADLITRTFANSGAGVPVYVESAVFEGSDAFVVVEAIGPKSGKLRDLRIWVIGMDGEVLYSGTR